MKLHTPVKNVMKWLMITGLSLSILATPVQAAFADSEPWMPMSESNKQVVVSSDPRIELISVLQLMIGAWPMTELDFDYVREVQDEFFPYWRHPVVRQFSYMWYILGFSQEIPSTFMLHLSEPPELKIEIPFSKEIIERGGGERNLNDFLALLRDFAEETDFMYFYEDHLQFYQEAVEIAEKKLETKKTIPMLEEYFGFTDRSYELILVPLFSEKGYATHVNTKYFALLGPYDVDEQDDAKIPYWQTPDELHKQLLKSFSYAFVNPIFYKNRREIEATEKLFYPIQRPMRYIDIRSWNDCIIEHLVRGISQRFTLVEFGEKDWEEQRLEDIEEAFAYNDYIEDWLVNYEAHRTIYPNFDKYYPVVLNNIRTLCEFPFIPTEVATIHISENGVQLHWTNNTVEPATIQILRKDGINNFESITSIEDPSTVAWTDENVEPGTTYWYKIAATNKKGIIYSYRVEVIVPERSPLAPSNVLHEVQENQIAFTFSYPFEAEGFTLFEWNAKEPIEVTSIENTTEETHTISISEVPEGEHIYYICAFITTENNEGEMEKLYSTPSNFIVITQ